MIYYFDSKNPKAPAQMGRLLTDMVTQKILPHQEIVILCIGSDRSTGDSLGPIIGHQFRNFISPGIYLLGDLNQPVHAANLNYCIKSMQKTFETGYTWFYSRSRQELWNKGATSGHLQKVISIHGDCDSDTLLVQVEEIGADCHTGAHSCFFQEIWRRDENE